jgi:hypothetical protein
MQRARSATRLMDEWSRRGALTARTHTRVKEGISQPMINGPRSDDLPHLSFATCLSSPETLRTNLLASPCLRPGTPHQVIVVEGCPSAADGLNAGFRHAKHELLVCVH